MAKIIYLLEKSIIEYLVLSLCLIGTVTLDGQHVVIENPAINDLRFYGDPTGGPDLLISANGKVGIGTTTPDATFHLMGDMKLGNLLFFATPVSFRM